MEGIICQWKESKGFGFIQPDDGSEQLFFDISSVKDTHVRPHAGAHVSYSLSEDKQQRLMAVNIIILPPPSAPANRLRIIKTESKHRFLIDLCLWLVVMMSLSWLVYQYYLTQDISHTWYFSLPGISAIVLLKRPKRPKESYFECTGCGENAEFATRTLAAWKAGFSQLYCQQCHSQWLRNRPKRAIQPGSNSSISKTHRKSGCLGMLVGLALLPIITTVGLYHWLI